MEKKCIEIEGRVLGKYFQYLGENCVARRELATLIPSAGLIGQNTGLLLIGGRLANKKKDTIIHLECDQNGTTPAVCTWKELDRKLKTPRYSGIPIIL